VVMIGGLLEVRMQAPLRYWAEMEVTNLATRAVAEAVSEVLSAANDTDLIRPVNDHTGMTGFTYAWGELLAIKVAVTEHLLAAFRTAKTRELKLPLGELTGMAVAGARGPLLPVRILPVGAVTTDMRFDFQSQGINQVLHRIYVDVTVRMRIIAPLSSTEVVVREQIPIAVELIQGEVPNTVINWSGTLEQLRLGRL
jgi:sporulation protein YunB